MVRPPPRSYHKFLYNFCTVYVSFRYAIEPQNPYHKASIDSVISAG